MFLEFIISDALEKLIVKSIQEFWFKVTLKTGSVRRWSNSCICSENPFIKMSSRFCFAWYCNVEMNCPFWLETEMLESSIKSAKYFHKHCDMFILHTFNRGKQYIILIWSNNVSCTAIVEIFKCGMIRYEYKIPLRTLINRFSNDYYSLSPESPRHRTSWNDLKIKTYEWSCRRPHNLTK